MNLKSLQHVLEQQFGLSGDLRRVETGLSHDNFRLGEVFVKLYSEGVTAEALRNEELALEKVKDAPRLIPARSGESRVLCQARVLSCFSSVPGVVKYTLIESPEDPEEIRDLGRYLAKLHKMLNTGAWSGSTGTLSLLFSEFVREGVESLRISGAPQLTLHGDFQPGNILYENDQISGVCDFEYALRDFRVFEIAMALSNLISGGGGEPSSVIDSFLSGYGGIEEVEQGVLPDLIRVSFELNLRWVRERMEKVGARMELLLYEEQTRRWLGQDLS
jgi:Ser/Thr protein kinase RdoA (MazF antagonist)